MKIYTKTGDDGTTGLLNARMTKVNPIFEVLGGLDELSADIGVLISHLDEGIPAHLTIRTFLRGVQTILLDFGSVVAGSEKHRRHSVFDLSIREQDCENLCAEIDALEAKNASLTFFILPGVYPADAHAQRCRAVCRRLEREYLRLVGMIHTRDASRTQGDELELNEIFVPTPEMQIYLNRLSDYFFVLARYLSQSQECGKAPERPAAQVSYPEPAVPTDRADRADRSSLGDAIAARVSVARSSCRPFFSSVILPVVVSLGVVALSSINRFMMLRSGDRDGVFDAQGGYTARDEL